jgi:hypothetical protein
MTEKAETPGTNGDERGRTGTSRDEAVETVRRLRAAAWEWLAMGEICGIIPC